jgi:hypothetical protein
VKFFKFFPPSCYAVIEQIGVEVKLLLYDSFDSNFGPCKCEFDLSFPRDPVTVDGSRKDEKICVEIVESARNQKFFSELLACNVEEESIDDVVLVAIDEKLLWVKFKGSFREDCEDDYEIETVTVAKERIREVKYFDGILVVLDESSILTVFYLCPVTQLIRKNEIVLEGEVKCFRFHKDKLFVYSNLEQVIFVDLKKPQEPSKRYVKLKGIVCLTIVDQFLLAICRNQQFFHIAFPTRFQEKSNDFEELLDSEIEEIPEVARFLENSERKLLELEKEIKTSQTMKSFMEFLATEKEVKGGEATIKFHRNFPETIPETLEVFKVTNQKIGSEFIELQINFSRIFSVLTSFDVNFERKSPAGILTRTFTVTKNKENLHALIPAENDDDPSNEMNLDLSVSLDIKGKTRLISYPITVKEVAASNGPRVRLRDCLDACLETIAAMKM